MTLINPVQDELDRLNFALGQLNRFGPVEMKVTLAMRVPDKGQYEDPGYAFNDGWVDLEDEGQARRWLGDELRSQTFYVAAERCGLNRENFTEDLYWKLSDQIRAVQGQILRELGYPELIEE